MKLLSILLFACFAGQAQNAPPAALDFPNIPDETVIAKFDDGVSLTVLEFKRIIAVLPPEAQQNAIKERETFIKQWALMRKLVRMAEGQKLDDQSPTRESLQYYRMMVLSQAEMLWNHQQVTVPPADAKAYYEANRDKYKEVHVRAIYLGFSDQAGSSSSSGAKTRTEDEAKALAAKLRVDLRGGADFVKLVKEYSEEPTSKAKDGDFGTFHGSDNIPEPTRSMVMALKTGEISDPVRQPNGVYLFRAEEVSYKPFDKVSEEIFTQLRQQRYEAWLEQTNRNSKVEILSPAFFGTAPAEPKPAEAKQLGSH